jgi:hypothetical protein
LFNPETVWTFDLNKSVSKSRNSPFHNSTLVKHLELYKRKTTFELITKFKTAIMKKTSSDFLGKAILISLILIIIDLIGGFAICDSRAGSDG